MTPTRLVMAIERLLTGSIRDQVQDLMSTEDLVIDAFRDLVKDELKSHIRSKVEEDPELKQEIKEAVAYYFHTKARTIYAELKATRAATRLGLRLLPDDLQGEDGEACGNRSVAESQPTASETRRRSRTSSRTCGTAACSRS